MRTSLHIAFFIGWLGIGAAASAAIAATLPAAPNSNVVQSSVDRVSDYRYYDRDCYRPYYRKRYYDSYSKPYSRYRRHRYERQDYYDGYYPRRRRSYNRSYY